MKPLTPRPEVKEIVKPLTPRPIKETVILDKPEPENLPVKAPSIIKLENPTIVKAPSIIIKEKEIYNPP